MKNRTYIEAIVPEGLEEMAWTDITTRWGGVVKALGEGEEKPGVLRFTYGDRAQRLLATKSAYSVFTAQVYPVPRPKALLGHQNWTLLTEQVRYALGLHPKGSFESLHLAAAGSDSAVMQRIQGDLCTLFDLKPAREEGDLLVRIRMTPDRQGWETLVRLSPRPLSVRRWRVCDYPGALNAAVAYLMVKLTRPAPEDVFLNLGCGSGTLLAERAGLGEAAQMIGCDTNAEVLACAARNLKAAGAAAQLEGWDATALPLADGSVDVVCSDLPFGHDVGSHDENMQLYPRLLMEAERVTKTKGRAVFLTHEIRLMENLLSRSAAWEAPYVVPVALNGLNPRLYVLKRR